jgi:hypothetical protein
MRRWPDGPMPDARLWVGWQRARGNGGRGGGGRVDPCSWDSGILEFLQQTEETVAGIQNTAWDPACIGRQAAAPALLRQAGKTRAATEMDQTRGLGERPTPPPLGPDPLQDRHRQPTPRPTRSTTAASRESGRGRDGVPLKCLHLLDIARRHTTIPHRRPGNLTHSSARTLGREHQRERTGLKFAIVGSPMSRSPSLVQGGGHGENGRQAVLPGSPASLAGPSGSPKVDRAFTCRRFKVNMEPGRQVESGPGVHNVITWAAQGAPGGRASSRPIRARDLSG